MNDLNSSVKTILAQGSDLGNILVLNINILHVIKVYFEEVLDKE